MSIAVFFQRRRDGIDRQRVAIRYIGVDLGGSVFERNVEFLPFDRRDVVGVGREYDHIFAVHGHHVVAGRVDHQAAAFPPFGLGVAGTGS